MKTAEEILREYIKFDDVNQSKTVELLPLTIVDAMEEYATQCQEDMKPLLKDLWDLWERLAEVGELHIGTNFTKKYEELKNSLNKQD